MRILETALALFNDKGLGQVSLRDIAHAMEISVGNLTYYYKTRDALVEALYLQLVDHLNKVVGSLSPEALNLTLLHAFARTTLEMFYAYRFIMIDFAQLIRYHKSIRTHYQQLSAFRTQQFEVLFDGLIQLGLLRAPAFEQEYAYLYRRMRVFGDYWLASALVEHETLPSSLVEEQLRISIAAIYPYLTKKGRAEYWTLAQ